MERITLIRTSDGETFETIRQAQQHCENRMGAIITPLARQLALTDKYAAACDFIEAHLAEFAEARKWQREAMESFPQEED